MKLIWHIESLLERDWLLDLLGDLVEEEVIDRALTCLDDDSIHVMSSNFATPAATLGEIGVEFIRRESAFVMRASQNSMKSCKTQCFRHAQWAM